MARSGAAIGSGELPPGMAFYSFMYDEEHALPGLVAAGALPAPSSLVVGMAVGAVLTAVRFVLDFIFFKPMARRILGFPPRHRRSAVRALDRLCSNSKILSPKEVADASASTGLSEEEIRAYAKDQRVSSLEDKKIGKFKEAAWRLVVYLALVVYTLRIVYGKPWFESPDLTWEDWPVGNPDDGLKGLYHTAMGLYWHFIVFQFWETRRSDFWQMLIHHMATLFLLTFSWLLGLVRIGALIMLCHDVSDIFMETAKLFNYAQKRFPWCHLAADGFFFLFAGVFGTARLYIFPKFLILSVWRTTVLTDFTRLFLCGLLCTLLVLHVFWFYLIMRMIYMFVCHGVEEDIRSDNEEREVVAAAATSTNGHHGKDIGVVNGRPPAFDGQKSKTS